jgi:uncharacterized protein YdeI (YjbR/CyaY-like superfamily)
MFETPADFRAWLEDNGANERELWVGYWKKGAGRSGLTYAESVDEALCFGWIDGLTKTIDADRYATRFTPRVRTGNWSEANIKRVGELTAEGRMTWAGLKAFDERRQRTPVEGEYTYETRPPDLPEQYARIFRTNDAAWAFWTAQRSSYRKSMTWWVVAAKREDTRLRRLHALMAESAAGRIIDDLHLPKLAPPGSSNG